MLAPPSLRSDDVNAALRSVADKQYPRVAFLLRAEAAKHISPLLRPDFIESLIDRQALTELGFPLDAMLTGGSDGERAAYGKVVGQLKQLVALAGLDFS